MRAFTLLELMVVTAIVGVLAAVGLPSMVTMLQRADIERSVIETSGSLSGARDASRGTGTCVDYVVHDPSGATDNRFSLDILAVPCPGDPPINPPIPPIVQGRLLSKNLTKLDVQPFIGGTLRPPVKVIHFNRDGAIFDPIAEMRITGTYKGETRRFTVFPAAGTVAVDTGTT